MLRLSVPATTSVGVSTASGASARAAAAIHFQPCELVDDTLREQGLAVPAVGGGTTFLQAKTANEVLKAQTAKVRLQRLKGELVDRARATTTVYDLARRERDAWMGWPPRVAANMAAELGVDPHALEQALVKYLRIQLGEIAEVKLELR